MPGCKSVRSKYLRQLYYKGGKTRDIKGNKFSILHGKLTQVDKEHLQKSYT